MVCETWALSNCFWVPTLTDREAQSGHWYLWNEYLCKCTHSFFCYPRFKEHLLCATHCDNSKRGSLTEGWRKKPGVKRRSAQEATGEGEDSSALNSPTKCTAFMSWTFSAKHDFSLSQVSRRVVLISRFLLVSEACNWVKTFSWKNSKSSIEESGTGSPCQLLGGPALFFVFFPHWLISKKVC